MAGGKKVGLYQRGYDGERRNPIGSGAITARTSGTDHTDHLVPKPPSIGEVLLLQEWEKAWTIHALVSKRATPEQENIQKRPS